MRTFNKAADIVRLGLHSLRTHKVRSVLTSLGIIFGVFSVIAMLAINEGFSYEAQKSLRELGSDNIIIESVKPPQGASSASGQSWGVLHYGLLYSDVEALRGSLGGILRCVTVHRNLKFARANGKNLNVSVIATEPAYADVARVDITRGRFIGSVDMLRHKPHCVITDALADRLFPCTNPLGKTLRLAGEPFTVIGTLRQLPRSLAGSTGDAGNYVIIPLSTDGSRLGKFTIMGGMGGYTFEKVEVSQIILQMADDQAVIHGAEIARQLLNRTHEKQDFGITVPLELIKQMQKQRWLWNFMFFTIASVSMLVGGIGIMNIMLASVTERTREIGIRRALGAKQRDIIVQFMVESVTLTTAGGLVGIGIGMLIPYAVGKMLELVTIVTATTLIIPFVMAVGVGLISGLYPALRAAKLDPIVALRHE